jgi:hypothetical protein
MRSLRQLAASGSSNPHITRRRYPTMDHPCRRVLVGNLTARNPLLAPNTVAIVGFVGFMEGGSRQRGAECIRPKGSFFSCHWLMPSEAVARGEGTIQPHPVLSSVLSLRNPDELDDV